MKTTNFQQMFLFDDFDIAQDLNKWSNKVFSADSVFCEIDRKKLEEKYLPITEITEKFNRQSVSYQLSKDDRIHGWLRYKEGFSAQLVEILIDEMNIKSGDTILDPFLGSGTTSLVAKMLGINSIGIDITPMTSVAMFVKSNIAKYDIHELENLLKYISVAERPTNYQKRVDYIKITQGAYPENTELDIPFYTDLVKQSNFSIEAKSLATLCILNSLERLSYTTKDGQYLRWDERSKKVIDANAVRISVGKAPFRVILNKGELPTTKNTIIYELMKVIQDIRYLQNNVPAFKTKMNTLMVFKQGSSLTELPLLENESIDAVITSPPYCNRYDYTRIYALELVYLGMGEDDIRKTRQDLLTCTVESKTKRDFLRNYYISINKKKDYDIIIDIIDSNAAFKEVMSALSFRNKNGDINNSGVIKMVKGYFEELTFIYYELFRLSKHGASVAFINDNVRYAGEVIPVDFISTELAQQIGYKPKKIYTLKQQKGNSSQQMKKFGKTPLRKSITIWIKE